MKKIFKKYYRRPANKCKLASPLLYLVGGLPKPKTKTIYCKKNTIFLCIPQGVIPLQLYLTYHLTGLNVTNNN